MFSKSVKGYLFAVLSAVIYGSRDDFEAKHDYFLRQTFRKHGAALLSFAESEERMDAR